MTTSRAAAAATLAAAALTLAMAWPVVIAPASRMFGTEIDGRHHDPFTVMRQFEQGPPPFPYRQPLVDDAGRVLARVVGPIPAFNILVLASFPLSVLTAFLLGRYVGLPNPGAALAAFAYAFAPLHLAHAAYHPHIAQTQWIPLYFLALWAVIDRVSAARVALWAAAAAVLALSNWYGAFICGVMTPFVLLRKRGQIPFSTWGLSPLFFSSLAFSPADLARYGAQVFAFALPPVEHPLWGSVSAAIWDARGMTGALVEQQVSVSWALVALAVYGMWKRPAFWSIAILAVVSAWCALAPPGNTHPWWIPSTWLYPLAPMFRAYARFAFVTHLMIGLLAGAGLMRLLERRAGGARDRRRAAASAALVAIAAVEYAPLPARARDVLPTAAHRWIADEGGPGRVLDCVERADAGQQVPWLMRRQLTPLPAVLPSCDEQQAGARAAALGYRYAIVRQATEPPAAPPGFALVRAFPTASVYEAIAPPAPVIVARIESFHPLERQGIEAWRWMSEKGRWLLHAPTATSAILELQLSSFAHPRRLVVSLDGREIAVLNADTHRAWHRLPEMPLDAGQHLLEFRAQEPASPAPHPDSRDLSIRLHDWRWR